MPNKSSEVAVPGFLFATANTGIRYQGRDDIAVIYAERPAALAAVHTTLALKAAPVVISEKRAASGQGQLVVVNAGNANAATGKPGMAAAKAICAEAAKVFAVPENLVYPASTGVIGQVLPVPPFRRVLPKMQKALLAAGLSAVAKAIMTTDTFPKLVEGKCTLSDGRTISVAGVAKGSGMIRPGMATMLSFVLTDAKVNAAWLQKNVQSITDETFNAISVDGDMSTNDTLLVLASGAAEGKELKGKGPDATAFIACLHDVCDKLARMIVKDGEGATKLVEVHVSGAKTKGEAAAAARKIAESPLVKTALAASDANWGRIVAAAAASGARMNTEEFDLSFDGKALVKQGRWLGKRAEALCTKVMQQPEYRLELDLKAGSAKARILTCDLTKGYIEINASYRS